VPMRPTDAQLAAATTGATSLTGGSSFSSPVSYDMLGDIGPLGLPAVAFGMRPNLPGGPIQRGGVLAPSVRGIKIADNESPAPQDRLYFNFNYWDRLNESVNNQLGIDVHNIQAYRYTFGLEKTFLDGNASVGFRLPLNSMSTESGLPAYDGTFTDIGDLSVILKYQFWHSQDRKDVLSAGIVVTAPTGPDSFAGANQFATVHDTVLQPFVGYRFAAENWFIHGFLAIDVPTDPNDVTLMYNDVGVGYFLYRSQCECDRIITAIVPTFECHINTPFTHRGALNGFDLTGTPDIVDLTLGVTFEVDRRSTLALAAVVPVTGPKPFDIEAIAQFNWRFGASARTRPVDTNVLQ
jgi:hypothetical protein